MRIGVLAARAGITPSRVRFYEAEGLLPRPARRDSGYRDYDDQALATLSTINRARGLGYTLKEIASYLGTPQAERAPMLLRCVDGKLAQFDDLLADTRSRLSSLQSLKAELGARRADQARR